MKYEFENWYLLQIVVTMAQCLYYICHKYILYIYIYIYITCDSIIINCSLLVLIADYIAVMTQLNMLNISIIWSLHLAVYIT